MDSETSDNLYNLLGGKRNKRGACCCSSLCNRILNIFWTFIYLLLCLFFFFFTYSCPDISYSKSRRWRIWDPAHYSSSRDRVWSGSSWWRFGLPGASWTSQPSASSFHTSVPTSELGSALHNHLQEHDGAGWSGHQQWPPCGECLINNVLTDIYMVDSGWFTVFFFELQNIHFILKSW